jgi:hypothetical protein
VTACAIDFVALVNCQVRIFSREVEYGPPFFVAEFTPLGAKGLDTGEGVPLHAIILASVNSHSDLPLFQGTGVQIYHCGMGTGDRRPPGMGGLQGWVATGMDGQLPWTGGQLTWTRPGNWGWMATGSLKVVEGIQGKLKGR